MSASGDKTIALTYLSIPIFVKIVLDLTKRWVQTTQYIELKQLTKG